MKRPSRFCMAIFRADSFAIAPELVRKQWRSSLLREASELRRPELAVADVTEETLAGSIEGDAVKVDLNRPMDEIRAELSRYPVKTRLSLTGPLVVARDIAHAKIQERLDAGEEMP